MASHTVSKQGMLAPPVPVVPGRRYSAKVFAIPGRNADVALLGAKPAFAEMLLVGRPNMPDRATFMGRIDRMFA